MVLLALMEETVLLLPSCTAGKTGDLERRDLFSLRYSELYCLEVGGQYGGRSNG